MPIREALPEDAADLASVHVLSWRAAYRDLLPGPYLDALDPEERAAVWGARLVAPDRPTVLLATGAGGRVVGFACFRAWRGEEPDGADSADGTEGFDDFDPATTAELAALYALPEVWGTGIGRELLTASTEAIAAAGFRTAALWVFAGNARGRRFYEAAGWRPDGRSVRDVTAGRELEELRYRRELFS
ncbi:GNAT family N-acetyltransferase [Streptomyces sp. NBC_00090]|uniref:GNAT family N-acetyltransferase n=1 Tax=Streptomyces sp. NBC_00090 TaxID=2903619 RepID=UPI00324B7440